MSHSSCVRILQHIRIYVHAAKQEFDNPTHTTLIPYCFQDMRIKSYKHIICVYIYIYLLFVLMKNMKKTESILYIVLFMCKHTNCSYICSVHNLKSFEQPLGQISLAAIATLIPRQPNELVLPQRYTLRTITCEIVSIGP